MRILSDRFMDDLGQDYGLLHSIVQRLRLDSTLDLQIRDNCVNVYYRGGSLMRLSSQKDVYTAKFDLNYCKGASRCPPSLPVVLKTRRDADDWVDAFQYLKLFMDVHFSTGKGVEREAQQLIVRDNNRGRMATSTDYFICDIEYARRGARFDLVGVHWQSTGADRKNQNGRRLVLIELKYGDGAIRGGAGLDKHVRDIDAFLGDEKSITAFKWEMMQAFNQKLALKLIDCPKPLESFSSERPLLMLILANHDPGSKVLHSAIDSLPRPVTADLCIATGNFMGYGLFSPAVLSPAEFMAMGRKRV